MGTRVVQVDRIRRRVIDEDGVRDRNGVAPASIPDWLALVGDTADGIPGIRGFGAKTAAALLSHYGTVEAIPADSSAWAVRVRGAARLAAALNAMRREVALYRHLATLVEDVPLAGSLAGLQWAGADRAAVEAISARIGGLDLVPPRWR